MAGHADLAFSIADDDECRPAGMRFQAERYFHRIDRALRYSGKIAM